MTILAQQADTIIFAIWKSLEFWPFLTFDPLTVGRTTASPWTLLHFCPCRTRWHCYFWHSKYFMFFCQLENKFHLLTPLMTFDPDEKKITCTTQKCIVPISIKKFYHPYLWRKKFLKFLSKNPEMTPQWPLTPKIKIPSIHQLSAMHMCGSLYSAMFTSWDKNFWTFSKIFGFWPEVTP